MQIKSIPFWQSFAIAATCLLGGCYKQADAVASKALPPNGVTVSNVTYTNYVYNLLKNNCSTCHGKEGSAAAFWINTNTYANALTWGVRIKETIVEGSMPPPPRSPFPQIDKDLLTAWVNRGMPE